MTKKEFENLMLGDTVLTTRGDKGTVNGWDVCKTGVMLKFKGRPQFATPWYRRHELKKKVVMKVKFEELDMESLNPESISVKNVKMSKDKSECDVFVNGTQIGERHIFNEELQSEEMANRVIADMIRKRDIILNSEKQMEEKIAEIKENRKPEMEKPTPDINSARHKEIDELAKNAQPMKFESDEEKLIREGFVRGAVVARRNAFDEPKGYGILTGLHKKSSDGLILDMTDGSSFNENFLEVCTDVNKDIMRTVEAEQGRVMEQANVFVDLIQQKLRDIIYG